MASTTSFEDLNDDCIRLIVEAVSTLRRRAYNQDAFVKNLSLTNKRIRFLCHATLFRSSTELFLDSRSRAKPTIDTFKALAAASSLAPLFQVLSVNLDNPAVGHDATFCSNLVNALAAMPKLSQLHLDLCNDEDLCLKLRTAFSGSRIMLPVKILKLSRAPNAAFVIQSCPSLETFVAANLNKKWKRTFAPLLSMTTLRRLEVCTTENWTPRRLEEIAPYAKQVPELWLGGALYKIKPTALAKYFSEFEALTVLSLTCVQWINHIHFDAFYYDDDDSDDEQIYHPLYEPPKVIAQSFFDACEKLETFRVLYRFHGTKCSRIRSQKDGSEQIQAQADYEAWKGMKTAFHPEEGPWF